MAKFDNKLCLTWLNYTKSPQADSLIAVATASLYQLVHSSQTNRVRLLLNLLLLFFFAVLLTKGTHCTAENRGFVHLATVARNTGSGLLMMVLTDNAPKQLVLAGRNRVYIVG